MSEDKKKESASNNVPGHFSNETIKNMSFDVAKTKCPKCGFYLAQIGMDGKVHLCLKCEGDALEKDFIF